MHEWSLLIFTVLMPSAIGATLFLWFMSRKLEKTGAEMPKILKIPLLVIVGISFIGLIASFFHLGTPTNALNVLRGFGRSWMSNEIVFTGAFIALICVTAGLAIVYKKVYPSLMLGTGLVGLFAIYCMASSYAITQVNGWDHLNTYVIFYGTAFTLGPVLGASLLMPMIQGEEMKKMIKWAFTFGIIGIAMQLVGSALFAASSAEVQMIVGETAVAKLEPYSGMIGIRWIIELVGLGTLGYISLTGKPKVNYAFVYAALLVFIVAEGMSRYVFYVMGA